MSNSPDLSNLDCGPKLVMLMEPENRIRFRYKTEGGSHGGLTGKFKTEDGKKSYPTVQLQNYHGRKKVFIRVSLYTEDEKEHVFEFKGKRSSDSVKCLQQDLKEDNTAEFIGLQILNKKKDEVEETLMDQKINELMGKRKIAGPAREKLKKDYNKEIKARAKEILNSVRLCFEAFEDKSDVPLCPKLFSEVICNPKSANKSGLRIIRLSHSSGSWRGGQEVILLCDKVQKENIKVRFFERDCEGNIIWEGFGQFSPPDVHYQVAIPFKTPSYRYNEEKTVSICLVRDNQMSEAREFVYTPDDFSSKKRKLDCETSTAMYSPESLQSSSSTGFFSSISSNNDMTEIATGSHSNANEKIEDILSGIKNIDDLCSYFMKEGADDYQLPFHNDILCEDDSDDPSSQDHHAYSDMTDGVSSQNRWSESIQNQCFDPIAFDPNEMINDLQIDAGCPVDQISIGTGCFEGQMDISGYLDLMKIRSSAGQMSKLPDQKKRNLGHEKISMTDYSKKKEFFSNILSIKDGRGNTLLHRAVLKKKNVELLLNINRITDINVINMKNCENKTALHLAVEKNDEDLVETLLKNGSNPNLTDEDGNNCYHIAIQQEKSFGVVNELLKCKKFVPQLTAFNYEGLSPLHIAIMKKSGITSRLLSFPIPNINVIEKKNGKSLLHYAVEYQICQCNCIDLVAQLLIKDGINVNIQDFQGNTPLHSACATEQFNIVQQLLQAGANPSIKNFKRNSNTLLLEDAEDSSDSLVSAIVDASTDEDSDEDCSYGQKAADLTANTYILELLRNASATVVEGEHISSGKECNLVTETEKFYNYLDEDLKWKKVAIYFVDESSIDSLELSNSPTKALLTYLKKENLGIDQLKEALNMAGLTDALKVIEECHQLF